MNLTDEIQQMKDGTHKWTRLLETLGAILLVAIVGWALYAYFGKPGPAKERGENEAAAPPPITRDEMLTKMTEGAPTSTTITTDERARIMEEMSKQTESASPTKSYTPTQEAPPPTVSTAERAKILEQMKKGSP